MQSIILSWKPLKTCNLILRSNIWYQNLIIEAWLCYFKKLQFLENKAKELSNSKKNQKLMATENNSSFVQPAIPRFDGHYDHWAMLMENFLRSKEY